MMIALHKNAATTPAICRKIAPRDEPVLVLALRYSVSEDIVRKWKKRDSFEDCSHGAHRRQTTLMPTREIVVSELCRMLSLSLDDMLAITREFLNRDVSRSGLPRCLRRHEVGDLNALKPKELTVTGKCFKAYAPGFLHIDVKYLPQIPDETGRR
jgi:hypothetical protein